MSSELEDAPAVGRAARLSISHSPGREGSEEVTGLGHEVAARFLSASLEVQSALSLLDEGPAADRCARALGELDQAIRRVRHLTLAAQKNTGNQQ